MPLITSLAARRGHGISDEDEEAYILGYQDAARDMTTAEIVQTILDAQADLQTGLGIFRLDRNDSRGLQHADIIEDRLAKSLARTHKLLDDLGHPMYQPATHPEVS